MSSRIASAPRTVAAPGPAATGSEQGAALVLVLLVAALLGMFVIGLLGVSDAELRQSRSFADNVAALSDAEAGVQEVLYRLNLDPATRLNVNSLSDYDARIEPDPLALLTNQQDDDGDGSVDDPDEIVLGREWTVRLTLTPAKLPAAAPYEVADTSASGGPPWGPRVLVPTIQPKASWRPYTTADPASPDVLTLRWKLDSDLPSLAAVPHASPQVIFWDPALASNGVDDSISLVGHGGDGNAANDSPYNIAWNGGTRRRPSGAPVLLLRVTGRGLRGGRTVARRAIEAELSRTAAVAGGTFLCGCNGLDVSSPTFVADSYRSSAGPYGSGPIGKGANVGSNKDCKLEGAISGSAFCGDNIQNAGSLTGDAIAGGAITGTPGGALLASQSPPPSPCACDATDLDAVSAAVDAAKSNNDNSNLPVHCKGPHLKIAGSVSCTLPSGTYYFTKIEMSDSASLLTTGTPEAPARIFLGFGLSADKNAVVNAGRPGALVITGDNPDYAITIGDDAQLSAVVNIPRGTLVMSDRAQFCGAATAAAVDIGGDSKAHADEDLALIRSTPGPWRLIAWRETN